MILRPYQLDSVARIIATIDPMVVAPTGSGKTVIVAEVIRQAENKFVCPDACAATPISRQPTSW